MKKITTILISVLTAIQLPADTNSTTFFRISSPQDAVITDFDAKEGTITWSNNIAGTVNQLQRAYSLSGTNNWTDFVQLFSDVDLIGSEKIINLNPPVGMVFIPGGKNSGINPLSNTESYSKYYASSYSLEVDPFFMDRTEVTKAQWDTVYNWATSNGYSFFEQNPTGAQGKAPDHPVHLVTGYDCVKWCNAKSEMEGRTPCYTIEGEPYRVGRTVMPDCLFNSNGYRLPTDIEWVYAARGGLVGARFPWGDTISHSNANYRSYSPLEYDFNLTTNQCHPSYDDGIQPYTSPVASFPPNGFGLYDIIGNVDEWSWPSEKSYMDITGGGYSSGPGSVRCGYDDPNIIPHSGYWGFRTVISN